MSTPDPSQPRKRGGIVLLIAGLALLLAVVSTVFSWRAAGKATDTAAKIDQLLAAQSNAPAPVQPVITPPTESAGTITATDPPTGDPAETPTGSVPTLDARTQYQVAYTDQQLTAKSTNCSQRVYIDLDEPRVQVSSEVKEISYSLSCNSPAAQIVLDDGVSGASIGSLSATPVECAEQIRTNPLLRDAPQPLQRGQAYCITTSRDAAAAAGISWKMVILSVTAIGRDGTTSFKASAWAIPS